MKERTIYRGDTRDFEISVMDKNGLVVDITGWTVFYMVKKSLNDTDENALIDKVITSHVDPAQGKTTVSLSENDTDMPVGDYYEEIQIKTNTGSIKTLYQGVLIINQDIIKRTL